MMNTKKLKSRFVYFLLLCFLINISLLTDENVATVTINSTTSGNLGHSPLMPIYLQWKQS